MNRTTERTFPALSSTTYKDLSLLTADLVCLSHLRWGFVYQRPQHLLSRFARSRRVFFVEEPEFGAATPHLNVRQCPETKVNVVVPQLQSGLSEETQATVQRLLLSQLIDEYQIQDYLLWFYTPMALRFAQNLRPRVTIYDCMDELSAFKFAPREIREREAELFRRADVVFTGGHTLYESKKNQHENVHPFPSSVDVPHFRQARDWAKDPADQAGIPHPRIGFCGVVDERMDLDLIRGIANARPDWQLVIIGPVVKIDMAHLPRNPNIHYLGGKGYKELPYYMAGWDAAMLPFAHNESTRFISPTKTPEYLSAGLPTVSTSIRDVVRPYGEQKVVHIADGIEAFVAALDKALREDRGNAEWLARVDALLAHNSWDLTWQRMVQRIVETGEKRRNTLVSHPGLYRTEASVLTSGD